MSRDRAFSLRFEISADDYDRLSEAFFAPAAEDVEKSRYLAVYLDTPDALLLQEEALWCFSRKDKIRDGCLKAGEWRLDRDRGARSFVKKRRLFDRLGGVFTMRRDRRYVVHHKDQMAVEIDLEHGLLRSGDRSATVLEVQFTLKDGEAEDLERLVSEVLPQAIPMAASTNYVARGYLLCGMSSQMGSRVSSTEMPDIKASVLSKDMGVADALKLILRSEIDRAMEEPFPVDSPGVKRNLHAVRCVQSVLKLFVGVDDRGAPLLSDWETALQKLYSLDAALITYLKPAVHRGQWETASGLVARIDESRTKAYAALAQTWPDARIKTLYAETLVAGEADIPLSIMGNEAFVAFISHELAQAADEIQSRGHALCDDLKQKDAGKLKPKDIRRLSECVAHIEAVTGFVEPLAKGKAARRMAEFQDALGDLKMLLDKDYQLRFAQGLVVDAAAHIARLKQTKTQIAQTYAAGALAGFLEAMKAERPEKALKKALVALSEVKPFWNKID